MAFSLMTDLVSFATPTVGTGAMTIGAAVAGYTNALTSGATYSYAIKDGVNYESGQTLYNGLNLTRTSVYKSTLGNSAISLSGNAVVVITDLAEDFKNFGREIMVGKLIGANFNVSSDQAIVLNQPGTGPWCISLILVANPSTSMTGAQGSFYAGTGKTLPISGGTTTQTWVALKNATDAVSYSPNGGSFGAIGGPSLTAAGATDNVYQTAATTTKTIYLSLTTAQGAAATADIYVFALDLS